jgi:hypothetical protein
MITITRIIKIVATVAEVLLQIVKLYFPSNINIFQVKTYHKTGFCLSIIDVLLETIHYLLETGGNTRLHDI